MTLRAGRYELLDTIASGGMATVHLGRAVGAGGFERLVAIKTMHPHLSNEPDFVAMFLDEARLAARIRHPNVVGTIDIQQDELGLLLVMDYVEGPSLSQVLRALNKQKTLLPLDVALRVMLDVLAGLHAAHELCGPSGEPLNVVHRDVSPQNVLVGVDGIARIMDFGVARAESRIGTTRSGDAKGKLTYMAPEQALQKEMDRRVDVYAAGLVFWELLTGRRLLRGENDMAIMHQIFHAEHRRPHEVVESVPPELSEVVMHAIARERDDRFPTTAAFSEAIDRVVHATSLTVATSKTVGAFVRELNLHKSPTEVASTSRPATAPSSIRTLPSAAPTGGTPAGEASSGVTAAAQSVGVTTSTGTESRGGFASTPPITAPNRNSSRKKLLIVAGGIVLLGLGLWFAANKTSMKDKHPEGTLVASAPSESRVPAEKPPEKITTIEPLPSATSRDASDALTGTTQPTPAASASASKMASPRPTTNPGTSKSPKTFIPQEL